MATSTPKPPVPPVKEDQTQRPHASHTLRWVIIAAVLLVLCAAVAVAVWMFMQKTPTVVQPKKENEYVGTVIDLAGQPLPNAKVHVGSQTVTTDIGGNFDVTTTEEVTSITADFGGETGEVQTDAAPTADVSTPDANDSVPVDYDQPTLAGVFGTDANATVGLSTTDTTALENEITNGNTPNLVGEVASDDWHVNIFVPVLAAQPDLPPPVDETTIITNDDGFDVVEGEIIIGWSGATSSLADRTAVIKAAGATVLYDDAQSQTTIATVADEKNVKTAIAKIEKSSLVSAAVENLVLQEDVAPNDPDYKDKDKSWWLRALNSEPAWSISSGKPATIVAVIDAGFQLNHPDLQGAFTQASLNLTTGKMTDTAKHGTHVSGIVAARKNNATGLSGIAPNAKVFPIRLADFGRLPALYNTLAAYPNVRIATMSQGFGWSKVNARRKAAGKKAFTAAQMQAYADKQDAIIRPAFLNYYNKGGVMCKSAGNDYGLDARMNLLNYPEVITVGAGTSAGALTNFSNVGPKVDVVAPGDKIWSTLDGSTYGYLSGTSMATPIVCGIVADIRSIRPNYGPLIIKRILQRSAVPFEGTTYVGVDLWRSLLRSTKLFGVAGESIDEDFNIRDKALITTEPSTWSVLPDSDGIFYLPYLQRQSLTVKAKDGDNEASQAVEAPSLAQDETIVPVFMVLAPNTNENTNASTNENTNTEDGNENTNEDENANTNSGDGENSNTNESNNSNDNTNSSDDANTNNGSNSDSVDGGSDGTTTTADGVVISAEGCAVSGFDVPDVVDQCPAGFTFSRDTIACEQTTCPANAGRTYTLECKCPEGTTAIYACDKVGYVVACEASK